MLPGMNDSHDFTEEQKQYLLGFAAGSGLVQSLGSSVSLPVLNGNANSSNGPIDPNRAAQERFLAEGKKLAPEEAAKHKLGHGLDIWDEVVRHSRDAKYPKGTDVFLFKFQGLFYVAPAQDSFMCRLRLPAGIVQSYQLRGIAKLTEQLASGHADVTTRANLQIREIKAVNAVDLLLGLHELGIITRGSGADNIRNVTCSPTAGIDRQELIDTRALAREMHHYILNHREMYGLPRKFNIAFDGGGAISALEDTNDIGFTAVKEIASGQVHFRLTLGGITGHKDFARDTGIMVSGSECVPVAAAIVRAFIEHGDRTDRKKARLKYVLDRMGFEGFIAEVEKHYGKPLTRFPLAECEIRPAIAKHGHIGVHPQKQAGMNYIGVVLPVGRISADRMRAIAEIADRYGSGSIRLTVWQNLLITDVADAKVAQVQHELQAIGLGSSATSIRGGLIACTGSAGCKFAAANTKKHAMQIAEYLESRIELDQPINIHLTGCHHSCAQHYIGDIGLIATKVSVGEDMVEGYHLFVGGGYGIEQGIANELRRDVIADELPATLERLLRGYLDQRNPAETFLDFVKRTPIERLKESLEQHMVTA